VRTLAKAEEAIEAGKLAEAKRILRATFPGELTYRADNLKVVVALRSGDKKVDTDAAIERFKAATEAESTKNDVHYRAWLAEAYIRAGKPDDARPILLDLHTRDVMPDAYGYRALAELSSETERAEYTEACLKRAPNKTICALPGAKKSAQARR